MGKLTDLIGQARRRLGLRAVTIYTAERNVALLREVGARLAEETARGEAYRRQVEDWPHSRRVVDAIYDGITYRLEVDQPTVGYVRAMPIGGRVIDTSRQNSTWIELTPTQAHALRDQVQRAVDAALDAWLSREHLHSKVIDETGVKTASPYRDIDPASLRTDDSFFEHEAQIARRAYQDSRTARAATDEPEHTHYFDGFHGFPSKCLVGYVREEGRALVAFSQYYGSRGGGTSPTNLIEELATDWREQHCADLSPEALWVYDHWPADFSLTNHEEFNRVRLAWNAAHREYVRPQWSRDEEAPDAIKNEMRRIVAVAEAWRQAHSTSEDTP